MLPKWCTFAHYARFTRKQSDMVSVHVINEGTHPVFVLQMSNAGEISLRMGLYIYVYNNSDRESLFLCSCSPHY